MQEKVEQEDYLNELKAKANEHFASIFPELELKIQSTPDKEVDLGKALEKDFSITVGKKLQNEEQGLVDNLEVVKQLTGSHDENETINQQFHLHCHGLIRQAIINILGIFKDFKPDEKHIILFEELELYLHPSNKRRFRDTLYKIAEQDEYQVICVSHDPQLIDLSREHISLARFIKLDNNQTAIYQAGDNVFSKDGDTKDRILMLNRFNPHLCDTFFSDEVILLKFRARPLVLA